jgi:hypothetical protein
MKYKFIFVVASTSELAPDNPYYGNEKRYSEFKKMNKMYYDKFKEDIKFFYVEHKEDLEKEAIEEGDYIYIKGNDMPLNPNFTLKMLKATNYIHDKYEYHYIIHTNLSSLWNIPVLLNLYKELPRNNLFGGHYLFDFFVTGTGMFYSHDLIPFLMKIDVSIYSDTNDVSISAYMRDNGIPVYRLDHMPNYMFIIATPDHCNNIYGSYETILYFRIRNICMDSDINIMKNLLKYIYNIDVQ